MAKDYNEDGSEAYIGNFGEGDSKFAHKFYIPMAKSGSGSVNYLYPDGNVYWGCMQLGGTDGYYDTEELAQAALNKYKEAHNVN